MLNRGLVEMTQQKALHQKMTAIAHNMANMNTMGFKNRWVTFKDHINQKNGKEGLSFVEQKGVHHDFSQGSLETTSNPLDCAISGPGFFTAETPEGRLYLRNGRFKLNAQGQLTTMSGDSMVDNGGAPIAIPAQTKEVKITSDGDVMADGATISRLAVLEFQNPSDLKEMGDGLYQATETPQLATNSKVIQGALERSNVSPITEMTAMIEVQRAYERTHKAQMEEGKRVESSLDSLGKTF